jgi:hypothetical protein
MEAITEHLDALLAPEKRSASGGASVAVSNIRDAVETSAVIARCMAIAKCIHEDLDNCSDPDEIRLLFARVLGVQPRDVPMQDERIKELVNVSRDELCNLLSRNFTPTAVEKMQWTMGLTSHVLIACNFANEKDRSLAQKIATYLVTQKNVAVYFKKSEVFIAVGVEHAKAVIVIASPEFQRSQGCAEELNYCDQYKLPVITILNERNFIPASWFGSILAAQSEANTLDATSDSMGESLLLDSMYEKLVKLLKGDTNAVLIAPELTVDLHVWSAVATASGPSEFAGDSQTEVNELAELNAQFSKKQNERTSVVLYHTEAQSGLAAAIFKELKILGVPAVACSVENVNDGLETTNKALVVCPLMSKALEEHSNALKILTYCNLKRLPIVPIKAEGHGYSQSSWLGVICAGLLWFEMSTLEKIPTGCVELQKACEEHLRSDYQKCDIDLGAAEDVNGYYVYHDAKYEMKFDFLSMKGGQISGQGEDVIGMFVLCGDYDSRLTFRFIKQYIGQQSIEYSGNVSIEAEVVVLTGRWWNGGEGDDAEIK